MNDFANEIRECRELTVFLGGDIGGISMKIYFPLLACALMLVVSEKALSTEYLSNLFESTEGYAIIGGSGEYKYAQSFWSGDDSGGYSLTSVTLLMAESSTKSSPLYVSLYISSGSQVGTKIGELTTGNRYSDAGGGYTWTPSQSITLLSNTNYWVVLETEESSNGYYWDYSPTMNVHSQDGWSIPATNTYALYRGSGWEYGDGAPQQIAVAASVVPEPSSYVLTVAGLIVGLFVLRRRQTRSMV